MPNGRQVGLVHGLVRLGLAEYPDLLVLLENDIPGVDNPSDGRLGVLGLADVRALARQPENIVLASDLAGKVDASLGPINRIFSIGGVVRGERAIDRPRIFPQSRGDDL